MKTFKQYISEENYNGRTIVHQGIKISFHDNRIDFHKGTELIHSRPGNYKVATKKHYASAFAKASSLAFNNHADRHNK
jgi:hypothetical protein